MTPHFNTTTDPKLTCGCGCGFVPTRTFMEKVEELRVRVGFPLPVTSGGRCPTYNAQVSSTGRTGPHTTGMAIDLGVDRGKAYLVLKEALQMGFTGIGVAQRGNSRFLHLDTITIAAGPRPTIWSY